MDGEIKSGLAMTERAREMFSVIRQAKQRAVFNQNQIREQIKHLCENHTLVDVSLSGTRTTYTSYLFDSGNERNGVWLDALVPREALTLGDSVKVRAQSPERKISFATSVAEIGVRDSLTCYRLKWPKILTQTPERAHPRQPVSGEVAVLLLDMSATVIHALLQDVSLGGIAAKVIRPSQVDLHRGDQLASCTIRFSEDSILQGRVQIRHVKQTDDCGVTFGAQFLGLSDHHHRILDAYIAGCQTT